MEVLRKHRNGGKQTVTVQHVNVLEGGQAIVGDVSHGGRVEDENPRYPHAKCAFVATMHGSVKALWFSMQKSRRSRLVRLPDAWRWRWSSSRNKAPCMTARPPVAGMDR